MSHVTLVRHGQAQPDAEDEESYDQLTGLGRRQAKWTGEYLSATNHGVRRIICGTLNRQRDTAAAIGVSLDMQPSTDERLNEIDYFGLSASMARRFATTAPESRDEFLSHFHRVMAEWRAKNIGSPVETFAEYEARVHSVLSEAEGVEGTLLVTSGGVIGMMMRHVLGLSVEAFAHALVQAHNTSIHRYQIEAGDRRLVTFNATPQFDPPARSHARTLI